MYVSSFYIKQICVPLSKSAACGVYLSADPVSSMKGQCHRREHISIALNVVKTSKGCSVVLSNHCNILVTGQNVTTKPENVISDTTVLHFQYNRYPVISHYAFSHIKQFYCTPSSANSFYQCVVVFVSVEPIKSIENDC